MTSHTRAKWLKEFNEVDNYPFKFINDTTAYCSVCERTLAAKKFAFQQHVQTERHKENLNLKKKRQLSLEEVFNKNKKQKTRAEEIGGELVEAFLAANIPLSKVENPNLRGFLEKHIGIKIPVVSTLRKQVSFCFDDVRAKIVAELQDKPFWLGVDETMDAGGRRVANILMGCLDPESFHVPFLLGCYFLEDGTSGSVARAVNDCLRSFWPNLDAKNFKVLLSDAASAMIKAGNDLHIFYPKMIHFTCLAHAVHRLCEEVRDNFDNINQLISNTKKIFLKSPSRVAIWKECCPGLPLPPEPCITR